MSNAPFLLRLLRLIRLIRLIRPYLYAEAELSLARGDNESAIVYSRKALLLFEYIDKAYKTYSQTRIDKINILRERLNQTS